MTTPAEQGINAAKLDNYRMKDAINPEIMFQMIDSCLLEDALSGEIDLHELAKKEMECRGYRVLKTGYLNETRVKYTSIPKHLQG